MGAVSIWELAANTAWKLVDVSGSQLPLCEAVSNLNYVLIGTFTRLHVEGSESIKLKVFTHQE